MRRGRSGAARKGGAFEAAVFAPGEVLRGREDAEGPLPSVRWVEGAEASGEVVGPVDVGVPMGGRGTVLSATDVALLAAAEAQEVEDARARLQAKMKLTGRERMLLKKVQQGAAQEGETGRGIWEVGKVAESLNAYWVNGDGTNYHLRDGSADWLVVPEAKLVLALQRRGVPTHPVGGEALSRVDQALMHVMEQRTLDRAIEAIAGFRDGVHNIKGSRVLVRRGPQLIEPRKGEWTMIEAFLTGRLWLDEAPDPAVQFHRFNYWMSRAVENLYKSPDVRLNSQVMILAGPRESAKSRLQHAIITPLLGGRAADPSRYVFGETTFNSGWMGCEHLLIEDPRPSMKMLDRLQLAQILKSLSVNEDQSLHAKQREEFGVTPEFVVSISINDDPDSLRILPPLTPDFADKVQLFQVTKRDLPLPTRTPEERLAFRRGIEAELPAYLYYLLEECAVPEDLRSDRFGVTHYHEPTLRVSLWEDTPSSELLALLDIAKISTDSAGTSENKQAFFETRWALTSAELWARFNFRGKAGAAQSMADRAGREKKRVWVGSYQELQVQLETCQHQRVAKKLIDHNAMQRLLARLAEDMPDRVVQYRVGGERLWFILAPSAIQDEVTDF